MFDDTVWDREPKYSSEMPTGYVGVYFRCNDCGREFYGKNAYYKGMEHLCRTDGMGDDECFSIHLVKVDFEELVTAFYRGFPNA